MSILIPQNTEAPVNIADFFPANQLFPVTLAFFVRASNFPSSGFLELPVIRMNGTGFIYASIQNNSAVNGLSFRVSDGSSSLATTLDMGSNLEDVWVPSVCVFESNESWTIYSVIDGSVVSDFRAGVRNPSGLSDLAIATAAWPYSDVLLANLSIYQTGLTQAQAEEFCFTGSVSDATPYAKWDADTDWGSGDIVDSSGNARDITPNASWTYSADNPEFGPLVTIASPVVPGASTAIASEGNVDPWTGARITDSAGNVKEIMLDSQTAVSAPALGTQAYCLFGDVTLELYNATESATAAATLDPPASHQYLVTLPAAPSNLSDTGYLHDWAPDDGYEGAQVIATVPIDDQGNILETDVVGEQTFYGIDDFDGAMQGFAVILGKGIIAVNGGNPLVADQAFTVEILDIHAEDVHYLRLTAGGSAWDLMPASVVSATELTFTAPADLPTGETLTLKLFEDKALRKARELEARIAALEV